MLAPVPIGLPPQLPLYHCQLAAVPRLPPFAVSVALPPAQMVLVLLFTELAAVELAFTFRLMLEQVVVLQEPTALT